MKQFAKRSLSMFLALVLCLSVLSGIPLPEAEAASYTYNWGSRGDVADEADFTRSTAEEWYAAEGTSYEELSQYTGSATTSSVTSSSMYQQLRSLMRGAVTDTTSYDDIKTLCKYTDCQNGGGSISSFYTGKSIGPSWDGSWNREHVWPNSKGDANGSGENDIFMLRPTTVAENSSRGNEAFGEGSSYYNPNEESGGSLDLRGDVARIILFVYVRWQDYNSSSAVLYGTSGVIESRAILLKWMEQDPVDTWELGRNDSCQSITGTRNVFVDYPELGFLMLGADIPDNYQSPSGVGGAVSYNITAISNNTSYGTVSVSGKTITATPASGYYVTGYTVTSGSATVTQSGNTFKVTPESDCTIRINFAAKTAVTLTFMENGITAKTINSYGGDSVTLPSNTSAVADGYTFLGWTDGIVSDTTTKPTIYTAGTSVTASNKTYYAVYSYSVGGTGVTEWTLKDITEIKSGDVFVITSATSSTVYALPNTEVSKGPTAVVVTVSGEKLASEPASNLLWNLGGSTNAWEFYPDGDTSRWLASTNDNNGMSVGTGSNKAYKINSGYLYNNGVSRYVGVYTSNPDWRCYTSSSTNIGGQTLGFYVKSESGTVYYSTSTFVCEHEDTTNTPAEAATCTETGYTAGVYCNDCYQYISGHEVTAALGHSWGAWVQTTAPDCTNAGVETATCSRCGETKTQSVPSEGHDYEGVVTKPTETQQGYTTYTCLTCGDQYVDDYVDALGQTFYVSFSVPKDVASIATMACGKNGITLPTAAVPEGYSFVGWTTAAVEETEIKPTVLTGTYNATANITLYALYTYTEGGTGSADTYTLYTGELTEGDYVIVYNGYAMEGVDANSNTRLDPMAVTVTNDTITSPDAMIVWSIASTGDGYYTIYNESAGSYAAGLTSDNKSTLLTSVTNYAKWTPSGDATYEFVNAGNSRYLRLNGTTVGWGCYSTSTGGAVSLYKGYSGTTYYTTLTTVDPVASVDGVEYGSFYDAYAAASDGQTVKLLTTVGEGDPIELEMTHDLYIDLDGWYFYADVTANGYTVYGKDSNTDTYDSEDYGAVELSGQVTVVSQDGYMAYDWGQGTYSFHAYELKLLAVSLDAANDALGYKAQFFGDEVVCSMVTGFGFNMGVQLQKTYTKAGTLTNGQIFTLRLKNILACNGGEMDITASAFVSFGETTKTTDPHSTTMRATVEAVNDNWDSYTDDQRAAVLDLYAKHSAVIDGWLGENNNIA